MAQKAFFQIGADWPAWGIYIVGTGKGYMIFENTKEGESWLDEYRSHNYDDLFIAETCKVSLQEFYHAIGEDAA